MLLCPEIKVNGKLYQFNYKRMTKSPDSPELKECVIPPEKYQRLTEVLADSGGKTK